MNGGCLCGAVRYRSDAAPLYQVYCHCRDCQKASGSANAPIIFFNEASFTVEGEVRYFTSKGSSGKDIHRGCCPTCGSQLFGRLERMPGLLSIRRQSAATLATTSLVYPQPLARSTKTPVSAIRINQVDADVSAAVSSLA